MNKWSLSRIVKEFFKCAKRGISKKIRYSSLS